MMDQYTAEIYQIIESYYSLSTSSKNRILAFIEIQEVDKDSVFIKKGTTNDYDYFLLEGICRSFIYNEKGDDITLSFFQSETVLTPNVARTLNLKSAINFQALSPLVLAKFKAVELVALMREISEVRNFANAVLQQELIRKSTKEIFNASYSAKERLIQFRKQYKALENLIPHPMIASYLGITNISLSRIRKELLK